MTKNLYGIYNISDYTISIIKISEILKKKYGRKKTNVKFKFKKISNFKFDLVASKFFKKSKIKKPELKDLLNEI